MSPLILFLFPLINCWGVLPHKRQKRYKLWFKVVIGPNGFTGWSYNFICITFSPELAYYFLLIFCMKLEGYSCQKNYRVQFLWKIHFCPNSGILHLFASFCHLFFKKAMQNQSCFNSWLSITNSKSGKIHILELLSKVFMAN